MRDVDQGAVFDLRVALVHPTREALRVEFRVVGERRMDGVDDVMEEISLVVRVAFRTRKYHPVGATGVEHLGTQRP